MQQSGICNRCSKTVVNFDFSPDKLSVITPKLLAQAAFWCETCRGVLCAKCAGLNVRGEGPLIAIGKCPNCGNKMDTAEPNHLLHDPSPDLKRPWWQFW